MLDGYDKPLEYRRENTLGVNIELHPSMIPFVTQFRVEEDHQRNRKVLVTFANINHNKLRFDKCAEITNNLAGNLTHNEFTQEPQIGQGLELFFYNWNKASCVTLNTFVCAFIVTLLVSNRYFSVRSKMNPQSSRMDLQITSRVKNPFKYYLTCREIIFSSSNLFI